MEGKTLERLNVKKPSKSRKSHSEGFHTAGDRGAPQTVAHGLSAEVPPAPHTSSRGLSFFPLIESNLLRLGKDVHFSAPARLRKTKLLPKGGEDDFSGGSRLSDVVAVDHHVEFVWGGILFVEDLLEKGRLEPV